MASLGIEFSSPPAQRADEGGRCLARPRPLRQASWRYAAGVAGAAAAATAFAGRPRLRRARFFATGRRTVAPRRPLRPLARLARILVLALPPALRPPPA